MADSSTPSSTSTIIDKQYWVDIGMDDVMGESLKGSLPFILPKGEYHHLNLEKLWAEDSEWLKDWLVKSGLVKRGQSPDKLLEYAKDMAMGSAYFVPDLPLGSDQLKTYILFFTLSFLMDDVVEDRHFFGKTKSRAFQVPKIGADIIRGKYKELSELPTTFPIVMPIIKALFYACELGRKANPKWDDPAVHEGLAITTDQSFTGMALLQLEDTYSRDSVSRINQSLYQYYRQWDCGAEAFFELAFMMYDVLPTDAMRKDVLYRRLMAKASTIVGHTNDIFGIRRDLTENVGFNLIVHKARYMPLSQAFAEVIEIVREAIAEFMLLQQRIYYLHGTNGRWAQVIRIVTDYIDGHLYWYSSVKRYGDIKCTLIEREPVKELIEEALYIQKVDLVTKAFNDTDYYGGLEVEATE